MLTWISVVTYFGFVLAGLFILAHGRERAILLLSAYALFILLPATIAVPLDVLQRIGVWIVALVPWILWKTRLRWLPDWFSGGVVLNGTFALVCFSIFLGCLVNHKDLAWIILCVPALVAGMLNSVRVKGNSYGSGRGDE